MSDYDRMNYASLPCEFEIDYCGINKEDIPWIVLRLKDQNIPMYYTYRGGRWVDYHIPQTILTERMSIEILIKFQCDAIRPLEINLMLGELHKNACLACSKACSQYDVTKYLLSKEIFMNASKDIWIHFLSMSD